MQQPKLTDNGSVTAADPVTGNSAAIFDNVFDLYGSLDLSGNVIDLRGRLFERTNVNPELLAGQLFCETVFWQSSENTSRVLEKVIERVATGGPEKLILDFRVRADEKIPVELHIMRLSGKDGSDYIFVAGTTLPQPGVPNRKHSGVDPLILAAENAEIGLWFWDFSENRLYSTPRCNELLGMPAYDVITYDAFLSVVHPDDRGDVDEFFTRSQTGGGRYEEEFRVVYPDGSTEWICAEGRSYLDGQGGPQRMMGMLRKITQQKLAADELARVYDREKKARDEAVEANRAKDFFLQFVSHELRSPLNAILGWSKILLTKQVDEATRLNALRTIERSARVQTKLINDLVDSARVASGKLRLEYHPTDLREVVRVSVEAQRPAADAQGIKFDLNAGSEPIVVVGDAGRLQQVFTNLISNAIKFTPEGGRVTVDVRSGGGAASVSVKDTGIGIAPEQLPDIFRQFSQGDAHRSKNNAGLGLGLSIVKILVAKHGGSVRAESSGIGRGAEFIVTLPLSESTSPSKPALEDSAEHHLPLRALRILIVEDDQDSREVLQIFLEQSGAHVIAAESAKAAMRALRRATKLPDLIISDLAMPEEDGFSFVSRVRQLPENRGANIPAIALSAFATAESKERAFESGFQQYSTKPFEPDQLIADIVDIIRPKS